MAKKREEVDSIDKWNVEDIYVSREEWEKDFQELKSLAEGGFKAIVDFQGKIESVASLKELLKNYYALAQRLDKLYTYAHLKADEDLGNPSSKEANDLAMLLYHQFASATSWIDPQILALSDEFLRKAIEELPEHRVFLEQLLRLKPHTLSEGEEKLLALAGKSLHGAASTFTLLNNVDLKFKEAKGQEVTLGRYNLYMRSPDRELRREAYESLFGRFGEFENTFTELLSSHVQTHLLSMRARGYKSCLEAALYPNQIDTQVYRSLIEAVHSKIGALHDYVAMRRDLLGYDKLYLYDFYVPIMENADIKFSFDEAVEEIVESLAPLGPEYQKKLREGLVTDRWVDRYENEGKRSGAYSSGCYGTHPYILMNYHNLLDDAMTLTHEAGHSMHTYHSHKHQPYQTSHYTIFVAEVASTFHEELLFRHLLKKCKDPAMRCYLLNQKIDGIRGTLLRQTLFAEFELKIHELAEQGRPLTAEILKQTYAELNRTYYGPALEIDNFLPIEYARIPHFYSNFYVYQYATGISAAYALVERVLNEGEPARADYLNFLSSGSSAYPLELLKRAGVDLTKPDAVLGLIGYFERLIEEFKAEQVKIALK